MCSALSEQELWSKSLNDQISNTSAKSKEADQANEKRQMQFSMLRKNLTELLRFEEAAILRKEAEKIREAKKREEAESKAREEAESKAREEAESKAREEAESKAREEAEAKAKLAAETNARLEAEAKVRLEEEVARRQKEENERLAQLAQVNSPAESGEILVEDKNMPGDRRKDQRKSPQETQRKTKKKLKMSKDAAGKKKNNDRDKNTVCFIELKKIYLITRRKLQPSVLKKILILWLVFFLYFNDLRNLMIYFFRSQKKQLAATKNLLLSLWNRRVSSTTIRRHIYMWSQ
eukprot:GHVR01041746.1.p1 GENE.GHVR01041746.1~~GHVR01041746.1.p1  ORF type:complete len:292 (+),score=35.30 GHVR01041746.1:2254-3129(+)